MEGITVKHNMLLLLGIPGSYLVVAGRSWGAANTLASLTSRLMEVTMSPEVYHVAVVGLMIVQIIVSITLRN